MPIELQATTEPGVRLVALAETLAEDFATRAGQHDKEGSYPFESIEALKAAGYFGAPIPEEFGGLGVTSVHDVVVASSRLARGDASVAIGVNMHLTVLMAIVRRWQVAREAGNERRTAAFGGFLEWVAEDGVVLAAAVSERSQDLTRPSTTAVRTESGWTIDGSKVFCTMSPAATVLYTAVSFTDDGGRRALRVRARAYRHAGGDRPRRLGRARDAGIREPLRDLRGRRAPSGRAARRLRRGRPDSLHGQQPHRRSVPRILLARHRRGRLPRRDAAG